MLQSTMRVNAASRVRVTLYATHLHIPIQQDPIDRVRAGSNPTHLGDKATLKWCRGPSLILKAPILRKSLRTGMMMLLLYMLFSQLLFWTHANLVATPMERI